MKDQTRNIGEILIRLLNKYVKNQRQPRRYGLGELLFPAEIHLIMLIGLYPDAGVTELAVKDGVTKGAVSQMVHKLEDKELIKRIESPGQTPRAVFSLTNKGKIVYYSHERAHEEIDRELYAFVKRLNVEQTRILEDFLRLIEQGIDKRSET